MTPRLARTLVRLYPSAWRDRFGPEFEALLETSPTGPGTVLNVLRSALCEHVVPTRGHTMEQSSPSFRTFAHLPSAFLPIAMSLTAVALIFLGPRIFGDLNSTDEGPTAHLWQLLIVGQLPVIAFFLFKWLRRGPRRALQVLTLQAVAVLANFVIVFSLGLG